MNNSYILLRNNKESSSLNLDALKQIGLKSTDLIWVECQSVCWQYPHEIAELKALVGGNATTVVAENIKQPIENTLLPDVIVTEKVIENKLVFVELPTVVSSSKKQSEEESSFSDMNKYAGITNPQKNFSSEKTDDIGTKYSRPLDEIKEMYVKNLQNQSTQKKTVIKLPEQFQKIVLYSGLIITGAAIMFFINSVSGKKSTPGTQDNPVQHIVAKNTDPTPVETVQTITQEPVDEKTELLPTTEASLPQPENNDFTVPVKKTIIERKGSESTAIQDNSMEKAEKKSPDVNEPIVSKPVSAEMISSKLSVKANEYEVGSFGGIRKLEMTLHNDSKYLLDKVTVELQYLNPEGIIIKTENIYFQYVLAGATATVAVKKSKRGVKIDYKVAKIESKETNNGTAGL